MEGARRFADWVSKEAQAHFLAVASESSPPTDLVALRQHYDAFNRRHLATALELHPVDVAAEALGGIPVHIVTPAGGATNSRTLLCLHGGAFMWGAGAGALLEAVPVAAITGMRVVAVDYRLAPEHLFPDAVDDVLAVYGELQRSQDAAGIGVYGCSAGGVLTAQLVARLIAENRPVPGAIAIIHGTGIEFAGDSAQTSKLFDPRSQPGEPPRAEDLPYFASTDLCDPLVLPGNHPETLAQFPASLLITGTRDFAASACATMHRRLLAAGVDALFVEFDGMWHAHHMAVGLPESRETFAILARFFDHHLALG